MENLYTEYLIKHFFLLFSSENKRRSSYITSVIPELSMQRDNDADSPSLNIYAFTMSHVYPVLLREMLTLQQKYRREIIDINYITRKHV